MNKKPVIGILPVSTIYKDDNENYYDEQYKFVNIYCKKIYEEGGIPVGILLNDNKLDYSTLSLYDGFLIPGGNRLEHFVYQIIDYAIKNNKPILGICAGMHAMSIYSYVMEDLSDVELSGDKYQKLKKENNGSLLKKIPNHYHKLTFDNIESTKHKININKDSIIYDVYKKEEIKVVSLHKYSPKKIGKNFKITSYSNDIIESIEYDNKDYFIVGVQWHPEYENNGIIKRLIDESNKRK